MARDEQHTHHWGSSLGIRPMALLHLPRAALLWTNSSDGDDLDNLFGPWPVTPSWFGPWPCYFLIYFAWAALEFRLSPNLRIEVRAEKHRHQNQKHTSSYRHCRPLQIKLPSIYMSFSNPRYHYHIRRFWDVWMAIHRRHFM